MDDSYPILVKYKKKPKAVAEPETLPADSDGETAPGCQLKSEASDTSLSGRKQNGEPSPTSQRPRRSFGQLNGRSHLGCGRQMPNYPGSTYSNAAEVPSDQPPKPGPNGKPSPDVEQPIPASPSAASSTTGPQGRKPAMYPPASYVAQEQNMPQYFYGTRNAAPAVASPFNSRSRDYQIHRQQRMPPVHYSTQIPHLGVDNSWNGYSQAYAYSGSQVLASEDQGYMHPEYWGAQELPIPSANSPSYPGSEPPRNFNAEEAGIPTEGPGGAMPSWKPNGQSGFLGKGSVAKHPPSLSQAATSKPKEAVDSSASTPQAGTGNPAATEAVQEGSSPGPERQSFAALIRAQHELAIDTSKSNKIEKQIVVAKAKPNGKEQEDSRTLKAPQLSKVNLATATQSAASHSVAVPQPHPAPTAKPPLPKAPPPTHAETKAIPHALPPAAPAKAPAKGAAGQGVVPQQQPHSAPHPPGVAKPLAKAAQPPANPAAKARPEAGGKPKPEASPPPKESPKKPAKAEAKPDKREDRPEILKAISTNAASPTPVEEKAPKKKAKGQEMTEAPPAKGAPNGTVASPIPVSEATPAPSKKKKKGKAGPGGEEPAVVPERREDDAGGPGQGSASDDEKVSKPPPKPESPQEKGRGQPDSQEPTSGSSDGNAPGAVSSTTPEEPKKKPKKPQKLKPKEAEQEQWDDEMLAKFVQKWHDGFEDPAAADEPPESKQDRRKRRKEAQEKKDREKLQSQPDVLTSMARQQMEMQQKRLMLQQCFKNMEVMEGSKEYKEQLAELAKGLSIAQQFQNAEAMTKCMEKIAGVYELMNDHANALKYYEKASRLLEEAKDLPALSRCYRLMATVYEKVGDHDKEMECHAKSVKAMEGVPISLEELRDTPHRGVANSLLGPDINTDNPMMAEKLMQLGRMYFSLLQSYRAAIVCLEKAQSMFAKEKETEHLQALPIQFLGQLYLNLRDYKKARGLLERCIEACSNRLDDSRLQHALVMASSDLGQCLLKEGRYKEAEATLEKTLEKAHAFGILHPAVSSPVEMNSHQEDKMDSYGLLQCALVEQKQYEQAWLKVENGRGSLAVETLRRQHRLEDRGYGVQPVTYDAIRELATRLNVTLVHYAELESDIACWVVQPNVAKISFQRLKKPFKRRPKDWGSEELMMQTHGTLLAAQQELIAPIQELLPSEPDSLIGFVVSDKGRIREIPFASLAAHGGVPLCRDHPLFTVHSVAVLAFLVDVLLAARSSPAELPIGLSDFLPHILVPHPDDPSKTMGLQHKHLLNEWGVDILLASLPRSSCLDDLDA